MRLYLEIARRSFQRHLAYRGATLAGLFVNSVFGVLIASVYVALYGGQARTTVAGFSLADALTFVWVGQSLIVVVLIWGSWEIAATVQTGDVVTDLMRPFDYFGYWLARDLGRAACHLLLRCLPTLAIGALVSDLTLPGNPARVMAFAASVGLAILVSFAWRFLLNLAAFWLLDVRGIAAVQLSVVQFFAGFRVPLAFFPPWMRTVAEMLPFRALFMLPVEVLLGQRAVLPALGIQLLWAIALTLLARAVLARAVRKLVVQGG